METRSGAATERANDGLGYASGSAPGGVGTGAGGAGARGGAGEDGAAVLVTGASTGIGHACAVSLARTFLVFACVRDPRDAEALRSRSDRIVPVRLDVTDAASIDAARRRVESRLAGRGLHGLVNNAGIGIAGPVEYLAPDALRRQFEVNVFGQIAVTRAFLPSIRRARGRIVNIGSVGMHLAIPFGGALCASKAAFGLLSDALRLELHPFGIHVCMIEPASIYTPAVEKTLGDVEGTIRELPPEGAARYGGMLREFNRRAYERERNGSPPEVVARAVLHALTARRPRLRYAVGKDAGRLVALPRIVPERWLDRIRLRLFHLPRAFGASAPEAR